MLTERRMVLRGPRLVLTADGRLSRMSDREVRDVASGSEDSKAMGAKLWWWWCVVMVDAACWAWSKSRVSLSETGTGCGSRCMVSLQLRGTRYNQGLWVFWANSSTIQGHLRRRVEVTSMAREADPTWSLTRQERAPDFS